MLAERSNHFWRQLLCSISSAVSLLLYRHWSNVSVRSWPRAGNAELHDGSSQVLFIFLFLFLFLKNGSGGPYLNLWARVFEASWWYNSITKGMCWRPKLAITEADRSDRFRSDRSGPVIRVGLGFHVKSPIITRFWRGMSSPVYKYKGCGRLRVF